MIERMGDVLIGKANLAGKGLKFRLAQILMQCLLQVGFVIFYGFAQIFERLLPETNFSGCASIKKGAQFQVAGFGISFCEANVVEVGRWTYCLQNGSQFIVSGECALWESFGKSMSYPQFVTSCDQLRRK